MIRGEIDRELQVGERKILPALASKVARTFQETNAADGREPSEIVEREDRWPFNQTVNEQAIRAWIDCGHARMMPFEVQIRRRYHALKVLQRRSGGGACRHALRLLKR